MYQFTLVGSLIIIEELLNEINKKRVICMLNIIKNQFRLCVGPRTIAFWRWIIRTFTTTIVVGLLMIGKLAVAQPSNLGDDQVFQTNIDLERATTKLNSAYADVEQRPSSDAQYALAVSLERMADLQLARAMHIAPYNKGYMAALELARNDKKSHPYTSNLIKKVERLEATAAPDSQHTQWTFRDAARRHYYKAQGIYKRLDALEPNNRKWQHALAVNITRTNLGHVGSDQIRVYYQSALDILIRLSKLEPNNDRVQRDLANAYEKIAGLVGFMNSSLPPEYDDAYAIRMKLFRRNEANPLFIRELAITLGRIRVALLTIGSWEKARDAATDEFGLYQDLAALDPNNMEWQRALANAHMNFAEVKDDHNGPERILEEEVLGHYKSALKIRQHLIQTNPKNTQWQMDLVSSYRVMAEFFNKRGLNEKELASNIDAQKQLAHLSQRYPNDRGWLFYQLYFYFSIGREYRRIEMMAAPLSQGGNSPEPEKLKAAKLAQKKVFKNMVEIIDTLVRMTGDLSAK